MKLYTSKNRERKENLNLGLGLERTEENFLFRKAPDEREDVFLGCQRPGLKQAALWRIGE